MEKVVIFGNRLAVAQGEVYTVFSCQPAIQAERTKTREAVASVLDYENPDTSGHGSGYYYLAEAAVKWCLSKTDLLPHEPDRDL